MLLGQQTADRHDGANSRSPFLRKNILLIKFLNFVPSDAAARPCSHLSNVDVEICERVLEIVCYAFRTDPMNLQ